MIELHNLTVKEYFDLENKDEYNFAIKYAFEFTEPVNMLNLPDIDDIEFGIVKDIQACITDNSLTIYKEIEFICKILNVESVGGYLLTYLCKSVNWLLNAVAEKLTIESKMLVGQPDNIDIEAGIEQTFDGLGILIQIDSLAGGDVTKYEQVRKLPYNVAFTKLYLNNRYNEHERRKLDIMKRKNK